MTDHLQAFIDALTAAGIQPERTADIIADDRWHAYQIAGDKPKKKAAYYRLLVDGDFAVGNFGSYRHGETHTWTSKLSGKEYTDEERAAFKAKTEKARQAKEEQRLKGEATAAKKAKAIWDGAAYANPDHTYLRRKKIGAHNFREHEGKLLVPMWADKKFWAYQTIDHEGDKQYLFRARKKGCYCPLMDKGESLDVILFGEGAATCASVREIIGLPVIICFDKGNIAPVMESFRKTRPRSKFIIIADNDAWQKLKPADKERVYVGETHELNSGLRAAEQAAAKDGYCRIIWPQFDPPDHPDRPTDFNDAALIRGEDYVRARIDEALVAPMPDAPAEQEAVPKNAPPAAPKNKDKRQYANWEEQLLIKTITKEEVIKLKENSINYKLIACNHPRLRKVFAYDEFHLCVKVVHPPPWVEDEGKAAEFEVHELNDSDIRNLDYYMQKIGDYGLRGAKEKVQDAIEESALKNSFHPARDYLCSRKWDGTPRLDTWLIDYIGCTKDDDDYVRAIGRTWMLGAVARVMEPGYKFDNMLILEGSQNAGKSLALKVMATFGEGEGARTYFMDTFNISNCEDTDELMKLAGVLIVEIQEMSGFNKKDDDAMKKFITTTHDTYRAPYGRRPHKWPRQFVLAGTYNPRYGIFKDPTGLRRYWVVATGDKIDIDGLRDNREQIWAEAVHRFKAGESTILSEDIYRKAADAANERRVFDDATQDVLFAAKGKQFFQTRDILKEMGLPVMPGKSQVESRAVNDILRTEGFERVREVMGGRRVWGWRPPDGAQVQYEMSAEIEEEIEF